MERIVPDTARKRKGGGGGERKTKNLKGICLPFCFCFVSFYLALSVLALHALDQWIEK